MKNLRVPKQKTRRLAGFAWYTGCFILLTSSSVIIKLAHLQASVLFDALVLIIFLHRLILANGARERLSNPVILLILIYCIYGFAVSSINSVGFSDYIYAFKSMIYLVIMSVASCKITLTRTQIENIAKASILVFLINYSIYRALGVPRPAFFVENNFELASVVILYFGAFSYRPKPPAIWAILLLLLCLISGSRSALGAAVLAIAFSFRPRRPKDIVTMAGAAVVGVSLIYYLFSSRSGDNDLTAIDRLNFLHIFLYETSDWTLWQYLFGTTPVTPLSIRACADLVSYAPLFSDENSLTCYSVILHSFFLRVVFDHGILGLIVTIFILYSLFRSASDSARVSCGFVAICAANGLSVSALSSGVVVFGLTVVLISARGQKKKQPPNATAIHPAMRHPIVKSRPPLTYTYIRRDFTC
ncbi:O-antigen and lipid-linked capsular repeat unit polymerase [Neorhizobium sp. NCHU2750]|nr:O-antigen and lipid-linked capsular repeat unit polymerase [Neorhizobium sp. NCHU2750]